MKEETELVVAQSDNAVMIDDVFKNPVSETLFNTINVIPPIGLAVNALKTII